MAEINAVEVATQAVEAAARARAAVAEVNGEANEASVWQVNWRTESWRCCQIQYQPRSREANYSCRSIPTPPAPASPLHDPAQPRDRPPLHRPRSAPLPPPLEPEKANPPSPPEPEEPPLAQIQPPQPSPVLTPTPHPPPSAEQAPPVITGAPSCSTTRARRPCRRPLSSARRGQARRARRAADPDVQERTAAFASAQAAVRRNTSAGSGKRVYTRQQLLSLRPQGQPSESSPLCAAALCFVPRSARYSCYARAVRLGYADPVPAPPCASESVPTVAAREMLIRVHASAVPH